MFRLVSLRSLLIVLATAVAVTVAFLGWHDLYRFYLERTPPSVEVLYAPRGVGLAPVSIRLRISDRGSGLGSVVVRTRQKGKVKVLVDQALSGEEAFEVNLEFPGEKSLLDEGLAELEIASVDTSIWKNVSEERLPLKIDYRRPSIELLSAPSILRMGGTSLIIYRATDEEIALSGIKIGNQTFLGYPAKGLDPAFDDPSMFVALCTVDMDISNPAAVFARVFAEDLVGNAASTAINAKIERRSVKNVSIEVKEPFLRTIVAPLADQNLSKLQDLARRMGENFEFLSPKGAKERLVEKFELVNEKLRTISREEVQGLLKSPRFESYWNSSLHKPNTPRDFGFGDNLTYLYKGGAIGTHRSLGIQYGYKAEGVEVLAASDGIVDFSENLGTYGRTLAIDHGQGLISLYAHLDQSLVHRGELVKRGQAIGLVGRSGFSTNPNLLFETRVNGIPVDPAEWQSSGWYYGNITSRIEEVKRALGMPVLRTLQ